MGMELLDQVTREGLRDDIPAFDAGDTVKVMVRVREGDKTRLQAFEGVVIARRGAGISQTFTVRKVSAGIGVERVFPLHSPVWATIDVVRRGRVRRAKLYYLRKLSGKAATDPRAARSLVVDGRWSMADGRWGLRCCTGAPCRCRDLRPPTIDHRPSTTSH